MYSMSVLSPFCVCQSVLVSVRENDTFICLSLTITSFLSVTKEYLKSLGNSECSPQTFLENSSSLDKLLIIIQNEDIAAHVHKVRSPLLTLLIPLISWLDDLASADLGIEKICELNLNIFCRVFFELNYIINWLFTLCVKICIFYESH